MEGCLDIDFKNVEKIIKIYEQDQGIFIIYEIGNHRYLSYKLTYICQRQKNGLNKQKGGQKKTQKVTPFKTLLLDEDKFKIDWKEDIYLSEGGKVLIYRNSDKTRKITFFDMYVKFYY